MAALLFPLPKRTTIRAFGPKTATRDGNYYRGRAAPGIRLLVIHDGETGEGSTPAEGMGSWFANPASNASAHSGSDTDSICRYVDDDDTAFCAPGANADGWHHELAGRASQTTSQWKDNDSLRILENGAIAFAEACIEHDVPARYLTDAQVADGRTKGITSHRQCTRAFKRGTHTDPGPNFPADYFLGRIRVHIARLTGKAPAPTAPQSNPTTPRAQEALMHTLVQLQGSDPVWLSDLITRRHIATPAELRTVQASLKARGLPTAVTIVTTLAPYGVVVGPVPK